jgi:hypothetical protein
MLAIITIYPQFSRPITLLMEEILAIISPQGGFAMEN